MCVPTGAFYNINLSQCLISASTQETASSPQILITLTLFAPVEGAGCESGYGNPAPGRCSCFTEGVPTPPLLTPACSPLGGAEEPWS